MPKAIASKEPKISETPLKNNKTTQGIGIPGLIIEVIGVFATLLTIPSQTSLSIAFPILALLVIGFLFLLGYIININRGFNYTREFNLLDT